MNTDDKVYQPEVITENPFPGGDVSVPANPATAPNTYTPTTTKVEAPFPKKKIAVELLSQAINTRNKKILQEFELQQSGGLQIGNFENGVTGDLRITPNGITARDSAGITTFAIDATTGDAIFRGTIRAGSIITGGTITNEAGDIIIDDDGLVSSNSFRSTSVEYNSNFTTTATSASPVQVTNMSLTLPTLTRSTNILIFTNATIYGTPTSAGDFEGETFIQVYYDTPTSSDNSFGNPLRYRMSTIAGESRGDVNTVSGSFFLTVPAGSNTIKLMMYKADYGVGNYTAAGLGFQLIYLILGS